MLNTLRSLKLFSKGIPDKKKKKREVQREMTRKSVTLPAKDGEGFTVA